MKKILSEVKDADFMDYYFHLEYSLSFEANIYLEAAVGVGGQARPTKKQVFKENSIPWVGIWAACPSAFWDHNRRRGAVMSLCPPVMGQEADIQRNTHVGAPEGWWSHPWVGRSPASALGLCRAMGTDTKKADGAETTLQVVKRGLGNTRVTFPVSQRRECGCRLSYGACPTGDPASLFLSFPLYERPFHHL